MTRIAITAALVLSFTTAAMAQSAGSGATVGPGGVGGEASASGGIWQHAETDSRTGKVDIGRGLAIGVGPNGLSLSHSIAAGKGPLSVGHNINMTIGQNGTHVSQGGVLSAGGQTSVGVGGSTQGGPGLGGGSTVTGNGWNTQAWSDANTQHRYGYRTMPGTVSMPMTSGPVPMGQPMPIQNTMGQPIQMGQPMPVNRIGQPVQMGQPMPVRHMQGRVVYPQVIQNRGQIQSGQLRHKIAVPVRHLPVRFGR